MIQQKKRRKAILATVAFLMTSSMVFGWNEKAGEEKSRFSIGAGIGIPYGVIGFSFEINPILSRHLDKISDFYSLNIGLGFAGVAPGYSFGVRIYPIGRKMTWQPKVSFNYGSVAVVNWSYVARGFSLGAGSIFRFNKKLSLDGDIIFVLNAFGYDISDFGRVKLSLGLRLHLD